MEKFINPFYSMRVFDRHEIHELVKGADKVTKLHSNGWYKFNACYDINYNVIVSYSEYVLFDDENDTGNKCIRVTFHDQTYVYASYSWDAFTKWLNEVYLPVYYNWCSTLNLNKNNDASS